MANNIAEDEKLQLKEKKEIVLVRCEAVIFEVLYVFGYGVFTGSSFLFLWNMHNQESPAVVLVPAEWTSLWSLLCELVKPLGEVCK